VAKQGLYANIHAKRKRIMLDREKRCVNRGQKALRQPKPLRRPRRQQRNNGKIHVK
jgi:hypothetical protein